MSKFRHDKEEGKDMFRILLKRYSLTTCLAVLFSILLVEPQARATLLIDSESTSYVFNAGEVALLNVSVYSEANNQFKYEYNLQNQGVGLSLQFISIGYGPSSSAEEDVTVAGSAVPGNNVVTINPAYYYREYNYLMDGSVVVNFSPTTLDPGESIVFSVIYNGFVFQQSVALGGVLAGSLVGKNGTLSYDKADAANPVPEPATLLLLGSGIVSLGVLSRKRRKR